LITGDFLAEDFSYNNNYLVRVTKAAVKQGLKLPITNEQRLEIIKSIKLLKHWSQIKAEIRKFEKDLKHSDARNKLNLFPGGKKL
jgi:hypothetical protein